MVKGKDMKRKWEIIPLSYDLMFKHIFGTNKNKKYTARLLESLFNLKEGALKNIEIVNSVKLDRKRVESKKFELDILVQLPNGNQINIEMQRENDENSEIKNTLYVMGKFEDSLKEGEDYEDISKILQVDFVKDNKVHKEKEIVKMYGIMNFKNPNDLILGRVFRIIVIDVDSKVDIHYTNINKEFLIWRKLIGTEIKKEIEAIGRKGSIFRGVVEEMKLFSGKKYVQDYTGKDRLIKSRINSAKKEGKFEGKLEGKFEEKYKIAKNLIDKMTPKEIADVTGLSIESINDLIKKQA